MSYARSDRALNARRIKSESPGLIPRALLRARGLLGGSASEQRELPLSHYQRMNAAQRASFISDLTRRELQVLELLSQGLDNTTIAAILSIREEDRAQSGLRDQQTWVSNRAQAVARARDAGYGRQKIA